MNHYHVNLVAAAPMDATITSPAQQLFNVNGYSIQAIYTGSTISGTFELQVSGDPLNPDGITPPTNWDVLANSSATVTSAGIYIWNVSSPFYNYVRVIYTDASDGTSNGVCSISYNAKDYS